MDIYNFPPPHVKSIPVGDYPRPTFDPKKNIIRVTPAANRPNITFRSGPQQRPKPTHPQRPNSAYPSPYKIQTNPMDPKCIMENASTSSTTNQPQPQPQLQSCSQDEVNRNVSSIPPYLRRGPSIDPASNNFPIQSPAVTSPAAYQHRPRF